MVRYRRILPLLLIFAWVVIRTTALPAGADERISKSVAAYTGYGGKWVRAKTVDALLGYGERYNIPSGIKIGVPATIEIVIDKTPGQKMDKDDLEALRSYVERDKHQLLATGRYRPNGQDSECAITHRNGKTYLWRGVTNVGLIPTLISFVPGATRDRDLLLIEWLPYTPNSRIVSAFQRSAE